MKKTEITMWDLRNEGMSDELYRYFSNSDYCVYEGGDGFDIYIGRDYCQTFPTIEAVIASFQEMFDEDHKEEEKK